MVAQTRRGCRAVTVVSAASRWAAAIRRSTGREAPGTVPSPSTCRPGSTARTRGSGEWPWCTDSVGSTQSTSTYWARARARWWSVAGNPSQALPAQKTTSFLSATISPSSAVPGAPG